MAAEVPASAGLGSFLSQEQQTAFNAALDAKSAGEDTSLPLSPYPPLTTINSQRLQPLLKLRDLQSRVVVESRAVEGGLPRLRPREMENSHGARYFTMVRPNSM